MRHLSILRGIAMFLCGVSITLAAVLTRAQTAPSAPPERRDVASLIGPRQDRPGWVIDVDHLLDPIEPDLYLLIGKWKYQCSDAEIEEEREDWDHWAGSYADNYARPFVVLVRTSPEYVPTAGPSGLTLVGYLELETTGECGSSTRSVSDFGWGIARVRDFDGDGRLELALIDAYTEYCPGSTFGEIWTREIRWLSFLGNTPIDTQLHLILERHLGGRDDVVTLTRTHRYRDREGSAFRDIRVRTERPRDGGEQEEQLYRYDGALDRWVLPESSGDER